jgi:hypothetical protein
MNDPPDVAAVRPDVWAKDAKLKKVRSAARKSGKLRLASRAHHPHQRHVGKVVALGEQLQRYQSLCALLSDGVLLRRH